MEIKKNPKADLRQNILTYLLAGFALMMLLSWQALEFTTRTEEEEEVYEEEDLVFEEEEEVPIVMMLDTPPPPPPPPPVPERIEIVEKEKEIIETIIAPVDTKIEEVIREPVKVAQVQTIARAAEPEIDDVPFAIIQDVPLYPGCEKFKSNDDRKKCMSDKITQFVSKNFRTDIGNELGLSGRQKFFVQFTIDKNGDVVKVQSNAKQDKLKAEAERVMNKLPKMTPGKQRNRAVGVIYQLPVQFDILDN